MKMNCDNCGIEIEKNPSRVSNNNYCSIKCRAEHWAKGNHPFKHNIIVKCEYCGDDKVIPKNELKYNIHFCNNECKQNWFDEHNYYDIEGKESGQKCVCDECSKEFYRKPSEINNNNYCSKKCYGRARMEGEFRNCKVCNKEYYVCKSIIDNGQGIYCSNKCSNNDRNVSGENHPAWKGGLRAFSEKVRAIKEYRVWRKMCFENCENKCDMCGSEENLQVHHIKPMKLILSDNNISEISEARECDELWDVENGQILCEDCHKLVTFNKINDKIL